MFDRSAVPKLVILSVLSFMLMMCSSSGIAQETKVDAYGPVYKISEVKSGIQQDTLSIEIIGDSIPAFTVSEKFGPFRVLLDIAGATFADTVDQNAPLIADNTIAKLSFSKIEEEQPPITRFEFEIADTHDYKVNRSGNNIAIIMAPSGKQGESAEAAQQKVPAITDFAVTSSPEETVIVLVSSSPISEYKVDTLAGSDTQPARMFIDIPQATIDDLVREKVIGTSVDTIRVAARGNGARIVFDSATSDLFAYEVTETDAGLNVLIKETGRLQSADQTQQALPASKDTATTAGSGTSVSDATLDELIESSTSLIGSAVQEKVPTEVAELQDNFAFSVYNKQRISVDFYKIDIHNVFRLFRQITDLNIIVDEAVGGTLTLALSDVPWDFALDIILNLKDLVKEERFNTIVIYPKKKAFSWPERAEDNLSFEADVEVVEQEALIIEQSANQSQEIVKAKEFIRKARDMEQSGNFEDAAALYEEAAVLWPDNAKITNRLATLYLVNLGMNAKSLHYSKKSLQTQPDDHRAALYAAIASAKMQQLGEASEYFTQAISSEPPMKEALFSFAAFNENNGQEEAALTLLDKYGQYYGETVDTMLAKARIYDKIGETAKATDQYQALATSGYQLRPDLKKYILGRVAAGQK